MAAAWSLPFSVIVFVAAAIVIGSAGTRLVRLVDGWPTGRASGRRHADGRLTPGGGCPQSDGDTCAARAQRALVRYGFDDRLCCRRR